MRTKQLLEYIREFLGQRIWEIDPDPLGRFRKFCLQQVQVVMVVVREFFADRCLLRASALTYASLLSIVPLLAIMFALLKGFGAEVDLEIFILDRIALGSEEVVDAIFSYISNTSLARLGTVGLISLVLTVLALLSNIEESFNQIWGVTETRTLFRRFSDYLSVVIFGPLFILAAVSMTSSLESQTLVKHLLERAYIGQVLLWLFQVLPYVAMWAAFTFLYMFMPNVRINLKAAIIGGVFGGTLWQLVQWGYVNFQVGASRYNAIYGTMAALPIFMVWIYISWLIVLLGLEVTFAYQNLSTIRQELVGGEISYDSRETVALCVLLRAGRAFAGGAGAVTKEQLAAHFDFPPRLAQQVVGELIRLEFLVEVVTAAGMEAAYQPARALDTLPVHELLMALRQDGVNLDRLRPARERRLVTELKNRLDVAGREVLAGMTLADLVAQAGQALAMENTPSS